MTDLRSELAWLVEEFNKNLWAVEHEWGGPIEDYNRDEARAEAILKLADWQPIETAPKDGTEVLICWAASGYSGRMAVASWDQQYAELDFAEGVGWRDGSDYGCGGMIGAMPSHWMPLPSPPA